MPYVAKFPSHEEQPDHTLLVELAAARLGNLFDPPVVPDFCVVAIQQELVRDVRCSRCNKLIGVGPAFASREISNVIEFKDRVPPGIQIDPEMAARVVAFQTWLDGADVQVLISMDGACYSIDHGSYLEGAFPGSPGAYSGTNFHPVCLPGLNLNGRLRDYALFQSFFDQLSALDERQIVAAFGGIPQGWWAPRHIRVSMAEQALLRRVHLQKVLTPFWKG